MFSDIYAKRAYLHIRENLQNIEPLDELSGSLGISSDYLRHIFKAKYGMGIKQFLILTRIERAKDLLARSALPLKAIADICGFQNERYLCTAFKKATGFTPGERRRLSREKR